MYILNNLKINVHDWIAGPDGTQYPPGWFLDAAERERVGIVEAPDPVWPDPATHYASQNQDGTLTVREWTVAELADMNATKLASTKQAIIDATQLRLDTWARGRGYDSILSACTYVASAVPKFAAEGQRAVTARDSTWATLFTGFEEVVAGTRAMPASYAEIEPSLPLLKWPDED